jgi:multidrug efflux system membrane fusion protein
MNPEANIPRVLGFLLALPALFVACHKKPSASFARPPAPVTVATAETRDVPVYLDEVGKCVAREVVSVQAQVTGRLTAIHFTDGANLRTGDPLFTIDPEPFQAALASSEANLAQAKAVLALARADFERTASLVATKILSQQDYDSKKSAAEVAEAAVGQAEAAVETARINLRYCSILSPIDGRAGHRLVDIGNVVAANGTPLLVIQRLDPIYVDFTVTEQNLTEVQRQMRRRPLGVEVRVPDLPSAPLTGEVTFLDNAVQVGTGTVTLRATVANRERQLWPGRLVNVRLILDTLPQAVVVPADAPQLSAKGPFVYVVSEDGTASLRPVTPGQRQGDLVVIARGVKAGERVVVSGQLGVTPGGKVRIDEAGGAAPAAARTGGAP